MNFSKMMALLPETVKKNIIDFQSVKMKNGKTGTRILIGRILTDDEKKKMNNAHIVGLECIAHHKFAPEIQHSYFYVV